MPIIKKFGETANWVYKLKMITMLQAYFRIIRRSGRLPMLMRSGRA